jgi:4-hydroxy-3-polyprenylbenzoate decarboxylase
MGRYVVGITGASGSIYGVKVIENLLKAGHEVHLVLTDNGKKVLAYEMEKDIQVLLEDFDTLLGKYIVYENDDLFSAIASGSFKTDGMIIVPCSMGTLGKISSGITDSLLARSADVMLKERRPLLLAVRESPLNGIHLENMLKLQRAGADICPPMPAFYDKPKTIEELVDFSVGRLLSRFNIEIDLYRPWQSGGHHG